MVVSHDRKFLDHYESANFWKSIMEEATVYNTNYSGYLIEKERRYNLLMETGLGTAGIPWRLEDRAKRMAQAGMATNSR